jgi:hypothetical protein
MPDDVTQHPIDPQHRAECPRCDALNRELYHSFDTWWAMVSTRKRVINEKGEYE